MTNRLFNIEIRDSYVASQIASRHVHVIADDVVTAVRGLADRLANLGVDGLRLARAEVSVFVRDLSLNTCMPAVLDEPGTGVLVGTGVSDTIKNILLRKHETQPANRSAPRAEANCC